jgi:hypothetical protein
VAFEKAADHFGVPAEQRSDPLIARLIRETMVYSMCMLAETMRRVGEALVP